MEVFFIGCQKALIKQFVINYQFKKHYLFQQYKFRNHIQMSTVQERNQLRLSFEIKSLKQHQFTAQLYLIIRPITQLGMKTYRTSPTHAITNPRIEVQFRNYFKSYYFEANRNELKQYFKQEIVVEIWHNDRITKDILLGISKISLSQILKQDFKKIKQGYLVSYDIWLPIDEIDQHQNSIRKIGSIRIITFLQDLGPISMLKKNGFNVKNYLDEDQVPDVPQSNIIQNVNDGQVGSNGGYSGKNFGAGGGDQRSQELSQLQHKVVWQLQAWKKAEQAKTRLILKQKETAFWQNLSEIQKKSDIQKQKQFKKIQANISLLQQKLKSKMNDLIKRQQKLVVMQQELQTKMNEISRQIYLKDEQIQRLKKRQKEQKNNLIKQKANIELQLTKLKAENVKLKVQLQDALKQDQKGPINILKNQLTHKITEIKALRKQLQNCMQTKQQFKQSYQKMKRQVIERGSLLTQKTDQLNAANHQISLLKKDLKHLQQKFGYFKQQQFYGNGYGYNGPNNDMEEIPVEFKSEKERLIYKRKEMLQAGNYTVSDPLIKEIDKKIAALS